MKLRNKKTGEIVELVRIEITDDRWIRLDCRQRNGVEHCVFYRSLVELNDEWMDYTPRKPLIKDKKLRKVVRTWAEIAQSEHVQYDDSYRMLYTQSDFTRQYSISFPMGLELDEMTDYTIAELCGEEEE